MRCPRLIHRQPDSAAHSPPSRNLQDQGISRAKPLASLLAAKAPDAASKGQNMLNHFAAVIAWGRTNGTPGAGMLPTPVSISKTRRNISPPKPIANVLAAVSMENLLNVDL